jgi:hypothetical protein
MYVLHLALAFLLMQQYYHSMVYFFFATDELCSLRSLWIYSSPSWSLTILMGLYWLATLARYFYAILSSWKSLVSLGWLIGNALILSLTYCAAGGYLLDAEKDTPTYELCTGLCSFAFICHLLFWSSIICLIQRFPASAIHVPYIYVVCTIVLKSSNMR